MGPERRGADKIAEKEKPVGLISRLLGRRAKEKPLSALDWFEKGFSIMHTTGNYEEAIRAFALSIQLDPTNARAYLNRGIAYERIDNMQQAITDYSKAIELVPKDAKAYYIRGMLLWRLRNGTEAINDLRTSAELGYKLAKDFLSQNTPDF
jgi:Flp pilus assembly protein TadD